MHRHSCDLACPTLCSYTGCRAMSPSNSRALRDEQRRKLVYTSACSVVLITAILLRAASIRKPAPRASRTRVMRPSFEVICGLVTDTVFTRCFRMPRRAFYTLLNLLLPSLERNSVMARRSSGGRVEPATRLRIFLRILGAASYLDLTLAFTVGPSTVYQIFASKLHVVRATEALCMPGVPIVDDEKMRSLAEEFRCTRAPCSPSWGCIGALNGIALAINKPAEKYFPRHYYARQGFFCIASSGNMRRQI
jgi:hypothetical protein